MGVKSYVEGLLTITDVKGVRRLVRTVSWSGIGSGDTCQEYPNAGAFPGKTVEVGGTFGASTPVLTIQGRNAAAAAQKTMTLASGLPASFIAAGGGRLVENYVYMTPAFSGGDGTTSLNVIVVLEP
jgi:hypothetical protein